MAVSYINIHYKSPLQYYLIWQKCISYDKCPINYTVLKQAEPMVIIAI